MCELMWSFKFGPLYSSLNMNSARKYIHYAYPWMFITKIKKNCDKLILLISRAYLDCDFFVIVHCLCKTKFVIKFHITYRTPLYWNKYKNKKWKTKIKLISKYTSECHFSFQLVVPKYPENTSSNLPTNVFEFQIYKFISLHII